MRDALSGHVRLQQIYDQLWLASKEPLLRGEVKPYPFPGATSQHWGSSISGPENNDKQPIALVRTAFPL
jgi:hypothetical protein